MTALCLQDNVPCRQGPIPVYRDSGLSTGPPHVNTPLYVNITLAVNRASHVNMTLGPVHRDTVMSTCCVQALLCFRRLACLSFCLSDLSLSLSVPVHYRRRCSAQDSPSRSSTNFCLYRRLVCNYASHSVFRHPSPVLPSPSAPLSYPLFLLLFHS